MTSSWAQLRQYSLNHVYGGKSPEAIVSYLVVKDNLSGKGDCGTVKAREFFILIFNFNTPEKK